MIEMKVSSEIIEDYQKRGRMIIPVKYPKLGLGTQEDTQEYAKGVAEALERFLCSPMSTELEKTHRNWWNTWDMSYEDYRKMVDSWPMEKQFSRPFPLTTLEDRIWCPPESGVILDEEGGLLYLVTNIPRTLGGAYWDKGMGYFSIRGVLVSGSYLFRVTSVVRITQIDFLLGDCEENTYDIRTQWKWLNERINEIASHAAEAHGVEEL